MHTISVNEKKLKVIKTIKNKNNLHKNPRETIYPNNLIKYISLSIYKIETIYAKLILVSNNYSK